MKRSVFGYLAIALKVLFAVAIFAFLDYALPSRQTVRVTNTYNKITEVGSNAMFYASENTGTVERGAGMRDIWFIDTVLPNGKVRVFRNEDTGLVWPPYFKYDSSNLHAQATGAISPAEAPQWYSLTSYGWRSTLLSIYPNAISLKLVSGPDERPLNWPALLVLTLIGAGLLLVGRIWAHLRGRVSGFFKK